jgi:hypothetical protein
MTEPASESRPTQTARAAVPWHGRLETEAPMLMLAEAHLALSALTTLCAGGREASRSAPPAVAAGAADGHAYAYIGSDPASAGMPDVHRLTMLVVSPYQADRETGHLPVDPPSHERAAETEARGPHRNRGLRRRSLPWVSTYQTS